MDTNNSSDSYRERSARDSNVRMVLRKVFMERSVIKTAQELSQWASKAGTKLALDTETTALNIRKLKLDGVSLCDGVQSCYIDFSGSDSQEGLLAELRRVLHPDRTTRLIFHNAVFDLKVLLKYGIETTESIFCTMTAAFLIDENRPSLKLKELAREILGVKTETFEEAASAGSHSERFYEYALNDAEWVWSLHEVFFRDLCRQSLVDLFVYEEMPFQYVLRDLEFNGVAVDLSKAMEITAALEIELELLYQDLLKKGGIPYYHGKDLFGGNVIESSININSPTQVAKWLTRSLGLELPLSETGGFVCDAAALKAIKDKHEFVPALLYYRQRNKLLTSFLRPLPSFVDDDGRVRSSFHNTITVTGRLSSSEPNLQQLPKKRKGDESGVDVRECYVASEGYALIAADYSGQELRVLAEISKDVTMIDAFYKGMDLHLVTANKFFELGIPEVCLYTSHPEYESYKERFSSERDKAKILNFGIAYGKGSYGFSKDWGVSEKEAQGFIDAYFKAFPAIKRAIDVCHEQVRKARYVVNLAGRRRRFSQPSNRAFRQAFNFLIQGYSAEMLKLAAVKIRKAAAHFPEWDMRIVLTVHDELVYEVKSVFVQEAMQLVKHCMVNAVKLCVPLEADVSCGRSYSEAK